MSIVVAEQFIATYEASIAQYPYRKRGLILEETLNGLGEDDYWKIAEGLTELCEQAAGENEAEFASLAQRVMYLGRKNLGIDFS